MTRTKMRVEKTVQYRPEVMCVCLVMTEVVQELLTVHIAVSGKYKSQSLHFSKHSALQTYPLTSLL